MQRHSVYGHPVFGDAQAIADFKQLDETEVKHVIEIASDQGIAEFESRGRRYRVQRDSDYTYRVQSTNEEAVI